MSTEIRQAIEAAAGEEIEEVVEEVVEEEAVETPQEEVEETDEQVEATEEKAEKEEIPETAAEEKSKPPVDWSPEEREHWNKIPKEVQSAIQRRERDAHVLMQRSSESRKVADQFVKTVEPYRALMAAEGAADPFAAINGLMQTAAQLHMGNPQQKAERIAQLIQHYGVDIKSLDDILSGQVQSQPQPQQPMRDPRVDEMLAQRQQQVEYEANQTIQQFAADPQNEFFNDVRMDMADLLDVASRTGRQMSPQQAYETACYANPQIRAVIEKRKADEALVGKQGMMQDKMKAASSISGTAGSASSVTPTDGSIREILESQFGGDGRI